MQSIAAEDLGDIQEIMRMRIRVPIQYCHWLVGSARTGDGVDVCFVLLSPLPVVVPGVLGWYSVDQSLNFESLMGVVDGQQFELAC